MRRRRRLEQLGEHRQDLNRLQTAFPPRYTLLSLPKMCYGVEESSAKRVLKRSWVVPQLKISSIREA